MCLCVYKEISFLWLHIFHLQFVEKIKASRGGSRHRSNKLAATAGPLTKSQTMFWAETYKTSHQNSGVGLSLVICILIL